MSQVEGRRWYKGMAVQIRNRPLNFPRDHANVRADFSGALSKYNKLQNWTCRMKPGEYSSDGYSNLVSLLSSIDRLQVVSSEILNRDHGQSEHYVVVFVAK